MSKLQSRVILSAKLHSGCHWMGPLSPNPWGSREPHHPLLCKHRSISSVRHYTFYKEGTIYYIWYAAGSTSIKQSPYSASNRESVVSFFFSLTSVAVVFQMRFIIGCPWTPYIAKITLNFSDLCLYLPSISMCHRVQLCDVIDGMNASCGLSRHSTKSAVSAPGLITGPWTGWGIEM